MKAKKFLMVLLLALSCVLTACQGGSSGTVDSEAAMNNFLKKCSDGDYTITAEDFIKITIPTRDQVIFEYVPEMYRDFAVMSVNNEVFQAFMNDGQLADVTFLGEGQAIDAAKGRLPGGWLDMAEGNIWNIFYNDTEDPLKFVSYDDNLKQGILSYVGLGESSLRLMHEVYLTLDKEDPTSARIQAAMDDDVVARIDNEDIDLQITFGNTKTNALADAWMKNPVLPSAKTEWDDGDRFIFNSVFLPGYGEQAVPFPSFASYALAIDGENFVWDDAVYMRDSHASEKDMVDYGKTLIANGFTAVSDTDEDGTVKTFYRKLLREDTNCYSSILLEYDNGVNVTAKKYYDMPEYGTLDDINKEIRKLGYTELPASDNFTAISAKDHADEMTESWLYFFQYDMYMFADIEFTDRDQINDYLDKYIESLLKSGFTPYSTEEGVIDYYESPDGACNFRFNFTSDNVVSLLFKAEHYTTSEQADKKLAAAGFPKLAAGDPLAFRDLKMFQKIQYGQERTTYFTVNKQFDDDAKAEKFLDKYAAALEKAGFEKVNPATVGSKKPIAFYNEAKDLLVGIELEAGTGIVHFEFIH